MASALIVNYRMNIVDFAFRNGLIIFIRMHSFHFWMVETAISDFNLLHPIIIIITRNNEDRKEIIKSTMCSFLTEKCSIVQRCSGKQFSYLLNIL